MGGAALQLRHRYIIIGPGFEQGQQEAPSLGSPKSVPYIATYRGQSLQCHTGTYLQMYRQHVDGNYTWPGWQLSNKGLHISRVAEGINRPTGIPERAPPVLGLRVILFQQVTTLLR